MITLHGRFALTGEATEMVINLTSEAFKVAHAQWQDGMLIQNAFPTLDANQREFIMTGMTPALWEKHMGDDDD